VLFALASTAQAQSADALVKAREHYRAGRALYHLGNYAEAIREFQAGYELVPKPQFLIDGGQGYRKLGELARAQAMYQKFLATAPADDPDRAYVNKLLAEVEAAIASEPPVIAPAPSAAPPVAAPQVAPLAVAAPRPRAFAVRHWWIFPVGAVVLAGVATGIYFAVRPSSCGAGLGCIDFPGR
jgi:tetratricopeptide (TPR) repeat protein